MELLRGVAKSKPAESAIWLRNPSGRDARPTIYDAIYHQRRIVDNMAAMLGDAVTAFNYKMITKEASVLNRIKGDGDTGNHWVWHQDYAYCARRALFRIACCHCCLTVAADRVLLEPALDVARHGQLLHRG